MTFRAYITARRDTTQRALGLYMPTYRLCNVWPTHTNSLWKRIGLNVFLNVHTIST